MSEQQTINKVNGFDLDVLQDTVGSIKQEPDLAKCKFHITNKWIDAGHNRTTVTSFYGAKQEIQHQKTFEINADEPPILAGTDQAPNPVEHLLNSLAGCVTSSIIAHAAIRGIHIQQLESEIEGDLDMQGFLGISPTIPKGYTDIRMKFKVKTDTDDMQLLKDLANYSPVFNTLTNGVNVDIQIEPI